MKSCQDLFLLIKVVNWFTTQLYATLLVPLSVAHLMQSQTRLCITNSAVANIKLCLNTITSFTTRTTKLRVSKLSIEQTNTLVPGVAPMADEKFDVG